MEDNANKDMDKIKDKLKEMEKEERAKEERDKTTDKLKEIENQEKENKEKDKIKEKLKEIEREEREREEREKKLEYIKEKIVWYDNVIPKNPREWREKGDSEVSSGKYVEAILCYDEVLYAQPENSRALRNKAKCLRKLEKYSEAIICYDKAMEIDLIHSRLFRKIIVWIGIGQYKEAIAACDEILENNSNHTDALFYKSVCFFNLYEYENALEYVEKVLQLEPSDITEEAETLKQQILLKIPDKT